jgi:hypothetical protein
MLRLSRGAEGAVEPDPRRTRGGRGAYLCRREWCLHEALRRGRWAQAFRAPTVVTPAGLAGVLALVAAAGDSHEAGPGPAAGDAAPGTVASERMMRRAGEIREGRR